MADDNNAAGDGGANSAGGSAADQGTQGAASQVAADTGKNDAGAAGGDKAGDQGAQDSAAKGASDQAAGDGKKATDGADKGKDGDKAADAPVDYAKAFSEVKLPEGVTLDPVVTAAASEIFGKHKVGADLAKDLTSFFVSQQQAAAEQNVKAWNKQQEDWKTAAAADKAITDELRADAKTVFGAFSKESKELLEGYGFTNSPHLIKDLARFSAAIKDDSFVRGDAAGRGANGDARKLFPNSNMNP